MEDQVIIYTKAGCQECDRLVNLLNHIEWNYLEYRQGEDYTEKQFVSEFGKTAEYPQVAIGYKHVGSLKEFLHYFNLHQ